MSFPHQIHLSESIILLLASTPKTMKRCCWLSKQRLKVNCNPVR